MYIQFFNEKVRKSRKRSKTVNKKEPIAILPVEGTRCRVTVYTKYFKIHKYYRGSEEKQENLTLENTLRITEFLKEQNFLTVKIPATWFEWEQTVSYIDLEKIITIEELASLVQS